MAWFTRRRILVLGSNEKEILCEYVMIRKPRKKHSDLLDREVGMATTLPRIEAAPACRDRRPGAILYVQRPLLACSGSWFIGWANQMDALLKNLVGDWPDLFAQISGEGANGF
jgi:hypothetical protein